MAAQSEEFCDTVNGARSVDADTNLLRGPTEKNLQSKLKEIANDYDSIFSWDIKQLTGIKQNLLFDFIYKMNENCEMFIYKDDEFNLDKFYLQLIICYELYTNGSYNESLLEIESVVHFLESCKYDESMESYSDAFSHIAQATNAYIALTLNRNFENIMKNIKPKNSLNRAERAAISAVKARVFMEYRPSGSEIALKFADEACKLQSTGIEWIVVWLKAKEQVRHYCKNVGLPDTVEIDVAKMLCATKTNPQLLIEVSKIFMGVSYKSKLNYRSSNIYYKLSSKLILKSVELAKDDTIHLCSCLMAYIHFREVFISKTVVDDIIKKLSNVNNSQVDRVLGKYYLKKEKDYEKARIHLSRGMAAGYFDSSMHLVELECLLNPVDKFPLVHTLNMMYDHFPCPRKRLIILSQILLYYYYYENNLKEVMNYLILYMDQDIDDTLKKKHLICAVPLIKIKQLKFKTYQFFNALSLKLKNSIKYCHVWNSQEMEVINNTIKQFNKMSKLHTIGDKYFNKSKTDIRAQNCNNDSNKRYPNGKHEKNDGKINKYNFQKQPNYQQLGSSNIELDIVKNHSFMRFIEDKGNLLPDHIRTESCEKFHNYMTNGSKGEEINKLVSTGQEYLQDLKYFTAPENKNQDSTLSNLSREIITIESQINNLVGHNKSYETVTAQIFENYMSLHKELDNSVNMLDKAVLDTKRKKIVSKNKPPMLAASYLVQVEHEQNKKNSQFKKAHQLAENSRTTLSSK